MISFRQILMLMFAILAVSGEAASERWGTLTDIRLMGDYGASKIWFYQNGGTGASFGSFDITYFPAADYTPSWRTFEKVIFTYDRDGTSYEILPKRDGVYNIYCWTDAPIDGYPEGRTYAVIPIHTYSFGNWYTSSDYEICAKGYVPEIYLNASTPEPTSGMLLILGITGLALRRRKAA